MVKSMKMLDQRSLNPNQQKTLKEIEDHLQPEMVNELASRDRQFREMLSEIKHKSENMRRRKLHQAPTQKVPPYRGQPSFMNKKEHSNEIENILKLRVDHNVLKEFLGT
jgi:hypothetical protein